MTQETKGRTMIGTGTPVAHPRPGAGHAPAMPPALATPPPGALPIAPPDAPTIGGPAFDSFIGRELCGYLIRRKLAEGGIGVVYEGVHNRIGRLGAIKVLKPELCRSEAMVERFYQEARAVNAIRHENIVDIHDFGRDPQGRVFFVMEYLEGEPLSGRLGRGALGWAEAFPILEQTLRALKAAHDKGFVHRDLKPDNIWLRHVDGRIQVKLLDFGIAKLVGADSPAERLTQTGSVIGTPHYMSPEQINGARDIDHRADIYALGVIAYELFAGVTPFVGDTLQAIMTGHLFREPPRLAAIPADLGVPPPIAEIVDRMLVKEPAGRYDGVADVLADLHDVHSGRWPSHAALLNQTRPRRSAPAIATPSARPRGPGRRALVIGGVLAAAAIAGVVIWQSQHDAPRPQLAAPAPVATRPPVPTPAPATPPPADRPLDVDALRNDARTTLRAALRETEPAVRVQGSDALGKIKDQPATPALTELTQSDPDGEVRGHTAEALGEIGAAAAAPLLARLEAAAPAPLRVWYASALARLGDRAAARRLITYARNKDLAVSFKAGLTLAEISPPGDRNAIAALRALAAHEVQLNAIAPYAGALLLTRLAQLRDARSRKLLYTILEHTDEGARLAAAEGLARLGDDAGRLILHGVLANPASPNRLVAAVAQIPLGEYSGLALITEKLDDKDPGIRRLAARGLGEIGERDSLPRLIALGHDRDWTVRIAAAAAIVAIVGLDPQVLAQASVDWTRSALDSQDLAVRRAAAGVLADIPAGQAVPLLAQAIADPEPAVRLAASRSAGRIKTADAAGKIAAAVKAETDPEVKEQQVKALGEIGEIGGAAAHDALAQLSHDAGRIGVFAAGSLIAIGDATGKARLDTAVAAPEVGLRLAAVQAAATARNPIVVSTLVIGVLDRMFDVRLAAAEGLAAFHAEKTAALPVLTEALASKDAGVVGRALAALARFGDKLASLARSPAEMLESLDPKLRLAALAIVRALAPSEGVPLLRRILTDPDPDVRRAAVDAIEDLAAKDKDLAIKLYRPLIGDADPVVRSKASGQLARLAPPAAPAAPAPAPAAPPPPADDTLRQVQPAFDAATAAAAEAAKAGEALRALQADLATTISARSHDDAALTRVAELKTSLEAAAPQLDAAAAKVEAAAKAVSDAAGASPSPEAARLVDGARTLAQTARRDATAARDRTAGAITTATEFVKEETTDVQMLIAAADAEIATGKFTDAKIHLDKAARRVRDARGKSASLDYSYAQLYDKLSAHAADPAARRKLLQQAGDAFQRFVKTGTGARVRYATARRAEIAEELKELGPP